MNCTNITDGDDPIEKKISQNYDLFSPDLLLKRNPSTSEKYNDSENQNLQLKTIHELKQSAIKQSLNKSFFDPSFFKYTTKYNEFFLPPDTPLKFETILNHQKRDLV